MVLLEGAEVTNMHRDAFIRTYRLLRDDGIDEVNVPDPGVKSLNVCPITCCKWRSMIAIGYVERDQPCLVYQCDYGHRTALRYT